MSPTGARPGLRLIPLSLLKDSKHFLSHAGTAFAILALHDCGDAEAAR
jgi:hypothetical protein